MEPLITKLAAKWLFENHPIRSEKAWIQFLKNNRRNDRNPAFRIPYTNISGEAYYLVDDLNEFFTWEKHRVEKEISNNRYAGMEKYYFELFYDERGFNRGTHFSITERIYNSKPYLNLSFSSARAVFKLTVPEVRNLVDSLKGFLDANEQKPDI